MGFVCSGSSFLKGISINRPEKYLFDETGTGNIGEMSGRKRSLGMVKP
jgi:hypothetical protein